MHTLFSRMTSVAASAVMAVCTLNVFPVFAEDSTEKVTIHFEYNDPDISIAEDEDGNVPELKDFTANANDSVKLPDVLLEKDGYVFQGWTSDGVYGHAANSIIRTSDQDIVLEPVFSVYKDKAVYKIHYEVDFGDGNGIVDTSKQLKDISAHPNEFIKLSFMSYQNEFKKSTGWTDGEHNFLQEQLLIMPSHDLTLTPIWHNRLTLKYYAGDFDDIVGATTAEFDVIETQKKDIATASRFARIGYKIDHWHCDYDDKDYAFLSSFTMPDVNVTMTAVWVPMDYNVVFIPGVSGAANIKVPGKTGETIKVPEMDAQREGYTFGGWTYEDVIYQPGDDFLIKGAIPGMGIALQAVWLKEGEELPVTTTTSATTTTTTSAATTTTSSETTSAATSETTTAETTTTKDVCSTAITTVPVETTAATTTTTEKADPESNYIKLEVVNEKGEPAKGVVIEYNHHITMIRSDGVEISTGPIETLDTSKGNTVILTKGTNEGDSSYLDSFRILTDVEEHTVEAIPEANIKETHDKDKNIDIYIITVKEAEAVLYGDANCDGVVDISDAVIIMQSISNPSKYKLTEEGRKNADVTGKNDGVTNNDALAIQKLMLKLIDKLPEE
ncbi:MAG TPA: dockerin type I repeat-containing protein [Ruminococcus flavefaciens]|nr:dockerin type I repeat-containing protein [Ruminococcus flavefaciens]